MATPASIPELLEDLRDEQTSLEDLLSGASEADWDRPTPAEGWAVRDQVSHLAYFDEAATSALVDPESFKVRAEELLRAGAAGADPMAGHLQTGRAMTADELLSWWRRARRSLLDAAGALVPGTRVPWYGPPMSARSFVSARLMETWAHGEDVADALGRVREPTGRLRHIAHLGVSARPFSYAVRGLEMPSQDVEVVLRGPAGERWAWESPACAARVEGPALDFCLVVTQRRHVADTALVVEGEAAERWMSIAQAFAGPPGPGRPPKG